MNRTLLWVSSAMLAALMLALSQVPPAEAHEPAVASVSQSGPGHAGPAPLSARFRVRVTGPASAAQPAVQQVWYFHRSGEQVALLKGAIDEVWRHDSQGHVSFERVFHEAQHTTYYTEGELLTLGVATDWAALSTLVDPQVLAALRVVSRHGTGAAERQVLSGRVAGEAYRIEWSPALQLPVRLARTERDGRRTELRLEQQAAVAPAEWPQAGQRSADYVRLDAADFGDMDYEPVVRQSEALDIRLGWRVAHHHD